MMNRIYTILMLLLLLVTPALAENSARPVQSERSKEGVIDAFLNTIAENEGIDEETKSSIRKVVAQLRDESPADAITEGLIGLDSSYADAIEASDSDDLATARAALEKFAESENKFLAADASFYLARALMNFEEFEAALPILEDLTTDSSEFTLHSATAQYFIGVAHAGMLRNKEAIEAFVKFYNENQEDAPERLLVSAYIQAQELHQITDGELADISQRMEYSRRRLAIEEAGEETQDEQEEIVKMLNKLIDDAEKQEAQSNSKNSQQQNTQKQSQGKPQQPGSQQSPSQSKQGKGGSSSNPNGKVVKKTFDNGAQSPWSDLRDRARDPANTAAKEKLPPRYREMVENYFKEANRSIEENR